MSDTVDVSRDIDPSTPPPSVAPQSKVPDAPPGPGFWKASDGNWYPPEAKPNIPSTSTGQPAQSLQQASSDTRKARLALAVQTEVAKGARVESQTDYNVILRFGKPLNNTMHLIATIFTGGLWGIVWIILAIINANQKHTVALNVDEYGAVLRQEL